VNRVMAVGLFIGAVVSAEIVWHFAWRAFSARHPDNAAVQGLASVIS